MLVTEAFLRSLVQLYGKHIVYSDDVGTWYPEACNSLGLLVHRLYSHLKRVLLKGHDEICKG
jgi:hypothetical protein